MADDEAIGFASIESEFQLSSSGIAPLAHIV